MPNEVYELRIKQLKQWLDDGMITTKEMFTLLSQAIEELFINKFNEVTDKE